MTKRRAKIISWVCLVLAVFITYISYMYSFSVSFAGKEVNTFLTFSAFFVAVGLVAAAIAVRLVASIKE